MKISIHTLLIVCLLACATAQVAAQTGGGPSVERTNEPEVKTRNFLIAHRNRMRAALKSELETLSNYIVDTGNELLPDDLKAVTETIAELEKKLQALGEVETMAMAPPPEAPLSHAGCRTPPQPIDFCLGEPTHKGTDRPLELVLAWTEPAKEVQKFRVQVSNNPFFTGKLVADEDVEPNPDTDGGDFTLKKKHQIEGGQRYYWRVRADFTDGTSAWAQNGVSYFTAGNSFDLLSRRGFHLQKALAGPDRGELAEFGFLNTIGEKTVFSSTFALSWVPKERSWNWGRTNVQPGFSIEGALASDDSETEDAWRYRVSGVFSTDLRNRDQRKRSTFENLYYMGSLKLEGDKDFDVRKLSGEFMITPNSFALAMGAARPTLPSKALQFQWRPFFSFDAGHTFRRGDSQETKDTILRLVPRVRARVDLQFLRQWLNMNEVYIYADDRFHYLPLENQRKRNNFFTSGIEFVFTPNLGFGLTYTNGRSAPKFEKINTLQGILGFRF